MMSDKQVSMKLDDIAYLNPSRPLKKGEIAKLIDMASLPINHRSISLDTIQTRPYTSGARFKNGDSLLARITPCLENGKSAFVNFLMKNEVAAGSTEFIVLAPKNEMEADFIYYASRYPEFRQFAISRMEGTSGRQRVSHISISDFEFPFIKTEDRIAIGSMLRSLDDHIDFSLILAAKLEATAYRIFKSWFVDFDPVHAKAAGEKPEGMADDIAVLFSDKFIDTKIGKIPNGWQAGTLACIAKLNPEKWTTKNHPDFINYIDLSNVKDGVCDSPTQYEWAQSPSRARRVLRQGDTIIGTVRPGNRSFAMITQTELTGSTGFAVLRPDSDISREFLYLAATNKDAIDRLAHLADGAAYPAVKPEVVIDTEIKIPTDEVMSEFSAITKGMLDRASVCKHEITVLASIRDLLIPQLISGKLAIEDAETMIEEAIA